MLLAFLAKFKWQQWGQWLALIMIFLALVLMVYSYGEQQLMRGKELGAQPYIEAENQVLKDANTLINELQASARNAEQAHTASLANLDKMYQEKQAYEKAKSAAVVRDLRAGIARLQWRNSEGNGQQASTGSASTFSASASGSDGATTSELPEAIAGDIYAEADRADAIVEQLTACQQVVLEDRKVCGVQQ